MQLRHSIAVASGRSTTRIMDAAPRPVHAAPERETNDLLQSILTSLLRALDVVFGAITIGLAAIGTWLYAAGQVRVATVLCLWWIPVFNVAWSALTRHRDRERADLLRCLICLPVVSYLYVAETGILDKLWIPALLMAVGISASAGVASRRSTSGCVAAFAFAGSLFGTAALQGDWDSATANDTFGIALTGCVIALVAAMLGRTLDEARRQRDVAHEQKDRAETVLHQLTERSDELTHAIEQLHHEMEQRMRIEIELRQAQKLESVGRLAAGVAHEINTPVQFVSDSLRFVRDGISDLFGVVDKLAIVQRSVLDGAPSKDAANRAADATTTADLPYLAENVPLALERALDGLGRVATIVRSMKEFAHPDSKDMAFADLNRAIDSTLTMARNEYRSVADLETEFAELPPVRCHIGELNQAVLNIVVNAAHAIDDVVGKTGARGKICVRTRRDGDAVVISIRDTGGGIPELARDHIFDPFFTTKEVGRGTGQGLAIARSVIVDKHGGQLEFETELGAGTAFHIRLAIDGVMRAPQDHAA
jgi:signal transduction histidine kinase